MDGDCRSVELLPVVLELGNIRHGPGYLPKKGYHSGVASHRHITWVPTVGTETCTIDSNKQISDYY